MLSVVFLPLGDQGGVNLCGKRKWLSCKQEIISIKWALRTSEVKHFGKNIVLFILPVRK